MLYNQLECKFSHCSRHTLHTILHVHLSHNTDNFQITITWRWQTPSRNMMGAHQLQT